MITDNLILQVRLASRTMVRQLGLLDNRFSDIGSTSQCHALVELDLQGVMTLGQLSMALNLEKSTTSRLIDQLLEKEACHIEPDTNDRRNKLISLTKKGLRLVNKIHVEAQLQVSQALEIMSEEERNAVVCGLALYAQALQQVELKNECKNPKSLKKGALKDIT